MPKTRPQPLRVLGAVCAGVVVASTFAAVAAGATTGGPGPQPTTTSDPPITVTAGEAGYNAFPEGIRLPDGTIRVYYSHGSEHGVASSGEMRTSTDGGKTWSTPRNAGTIRSPIRLADGTIVAASTGTVTVNGTTYRRPASSRSLDGGVSWTTDGVAAGGAGFPAEAWPYSLVALKDGSLLMATSGRASPTSKEWYVRYLRSTDDGRTWTVRSTIKTTGLSFAEPTLAVGPDGRVVTAFRMDNSTATDGSIHITESSNSGGTWSPLRAPFPHASGLPRLAYLDDGSLLMMYRSTWTDFNPFRYARSVDDGATWSYGLDFTGNSLQKMMGGAWIRGSDARHIGVFYGLESDWYHAAVRYRTLSIPTSGIEVRGMTRTFIYDGNGTAVRVTGRVVDVSSSGAETRVPGGVAHFTLRSYHPADGTDASLRVVDSRVRTDGTIDVRVPLPRHGELSMTVDGMTAAYRIGTYRATPGFLDCPTSQTATRSTTYYLHCQGMPASGMGAEFQRWDGSSWVHQKTAWADGNGLFRTPISISTTTKYRLTIWQTRWTDRATSSSLTVAIGNPPPPKPVATAAGTYVALTPTRLLDTRSGNALSGAFTNRVARTFKVTGRGGVPTDAIAVTGNLTVTRQTAAGYVYLGPNATNSPTSSTLNFPSGDTRANGVTVALSSTGTLSATYVAKTGATTQLVFDVTGYFVAGTSGATYVALTPTRLLDTRSGNALSGAFTNRVARTFKVTGRGGVPTDAIAVTGNLTVTRQTAAGYVYLGPNATNSPTSSTLNFPSGDTRANGVTVALSSTGTLSATYVAKTGATTQLVFDVTGYFVAGTSGATYVALTPTRLLDTRSGNALSGAFTNRVARTFKVTGRGGVPTDAIAVTGNLTVTRQTAAGYVYLGPNATNSPTSSTLNFPSGDTRANGVTVALSSTGTLSATYVAKTGATTQLVFDVTGYFVAGS